MFIVNQWRNIFLNNQFWVRSFFLGGGRGLLGRSSLLRAHLEPEPEVYEEAKKRILQQNGSDYTAAEPQPYREKKAYFLALLINVIELTTVVNGSI